MTASSTLGEPSRSPSARSSSSSRKASRSRTATGAVRQDTPMTNSSPGPATGSSPQRPARQVDRQHRQRRREAGDGEQRRLAAAPAAGGARQEQAGERAPGDERDPPLRPLEQSGA